MLGRRGRGPAQREYTRALGRRGDRPHLDKEQLPFSAQTTTTRLTLQTPSAAERSPSWENAEGGAAGDTGKMTTVAARSCQQLPTRNTEVRPLAEPS